MRTFSAILLATSALASPAAAAPKIDPALSKLEQKWPGVRPLCAAVDHPELYKADGSYLLRGGKNGWLFRSAVDYRNQVPFDAVQLAYMAELRRVLARRGTQLVAIVPPPRGVAMQKYINFDEPEARKFDPAKAEANFNLALARLRSVGVIAPDILGAMRDSRIAPPLFPGEEYYVGDLHWTPVGANDAAVATKRALARNPAYAKLPKKAFKLSVGSTAEFGEGMEEEAAHLCKTPYKPRPDPVYVATPAQGDDGGGLFGSSEIPVVLAGTSFSREERGFLAFLQLHLGVEALNYAVPGGGIETAMLQYLSSADFADTPPKFLLWEFLYHHRASDEVFRKVIGTARGDCAKGALASVTRPLQLGETRIPLPEAAMVAASGHRLVVNAGDTGLKSFTLRLGFGDGSRESLLFDGSRMTQNPRFMGLDLPGDDRRLRSVALVARDRATGPVTVRVCSNAPTTLAAASPIAAAPGWWDRVRRFFAGGR